MAQTALTPSCSSVGSSVVVLAIQVAVNPTASTAAVRSAGETLAAVSTCLPVQPTNNHTRRIIAATGEAGTRGQANPRRRRGKGGARKRPVLRRFQRQL